MTSDLKNLGDKLWHKRKQDFPKRKVSDEISDATIYLSRVAKLGSKIKEMKEDVASYVGIKNDIKREIVKTIIMLLVISKDLDIDIWEGLDEDILKYFE